MKGVSQWEKELWWEGFKYQKKNFKWQPLTMEKEHTIKERPQKNRSGALRRYYKRAAGAALKRRPRPPFVVSYSGGLSLIVCSFSIVRGCHFKFFFWCLNPSHQSSFSLWLTPFIVPLRGSHYLFFFWCLNPSCIFCKGLSFVLFGGLSFDSPLEGPIKSEE